MTVDAIKKKLPPSVLKALDSDLSILNYYYRTLKESCKTVKYNRVSYSYYEIEELVKNIDVYMIDTLICNVGLDAYETESDIVKTNCEIAKRDNMINIIRIVGLPLIGLGASKLVFDLNKDLVLKIDYDLSDRNCYKTGHEKLLQLVLKDKIPEMYNNVTEILYVKGPLQVCEKCNTNASREGVEFSEKNSDVLYSKGFKFPHSMGNIANTPVYYDLDEAGLNEDLYNTYGTLLMKAFNAICRGVIYETIKEYEKAPDVEEYQGHLTRNSILNKVKNELKSRREL